MLLGPLRSSSSRQTISTLTRGIASLQIAPEAIRPEDAGDLSTKPKKEKKWEIARRTRDERIALSKAKRAVAREALHPRKEHTPPPARKQREKAVNLSTGGSSREALETMVSLHHTAASFMHDTSEIGIGFENAFRFTFSEPEFVNYNTWKNNLLAQRGEGAKLIEKPDGGGLFRSDEQRAMADRKLQAPIYWQTFKKHDDAWDQTYGGSFDLDVKMTARERMVKEALFGTWERGGTGMKSPMPSLAGIEEWLEAKGTTVEDFADEWDNKGGALEALDPLELLNRAGVQDIPAPPSRRAEYQQSKRPLPAQKDRQGKRQPSTAPARSIKFAPEP